MVHATKIVAHATKTVARATKTVAFERHRGDFLIKASLGFRTLLAVNRIS